MADSSVLLLSTQLNFAAKNLGEAWFGKLINLDNEAILGRVF